MALSGGRSARAALRDTEFEMFVRRHTPHMISLARRLTLDAHRAEDVVQDVLLGCAQRWRVIREYDALGSYVRRAVTNEVISSGRRRWRHEFVCADAGADLPHDNGTGADQLWAERDELWQALGILSPVQRAVLVLRYYEDLPDADIASVLDCSPSTVRSHARRGLDRLRRVVRLPETSGAPG
jgi:RNA polymerase sigma-70 factor (sigma-E family)